MIVTLSIILLMKLRTKLCWKWIVLWSLWATRLVRQPSPEVRVTSGFLRGYLSTEGTYWAYQGIPYATVQQRFQAPGPEPKWEDVFEAVNEHVACSQLWMFITVSGQEDCLVLNVYTPVDATPDASLPVMVLVHGGGFISGSGTNLYGPDYLVSKGVIIVTFNYRLAILGQLCLRTKEAPGNAAMKDQVAALRWVQANIKAFGGNPNDVTLFGESAGGASVSYHLISPMSQGLFQKAIPQSGSSLSSWAHQNEPENLAILIAKELGYDVTDLHEIYSIFMGKSASELVGVEIPRKEGSLLLTNWHFSPCVEKEIDGEDPFLIESPFKLLSAGNFSKIPMIIGANDQEGYFFMNFEKDLSKIRFEKSLPPELKFPSEQELKTAANEIQQMYIGDGIISKENLVNFSRFEGELQFNFPIAQETELIVNSNHQPIFSYLFNYSGRRNAIKLLAGAPISSGPGASHADDLFYLFRQYWLPMLGEDEMVDRMTTLWTNFAKYGEPTPDNSMGFEWEPVKIHDPRSLVLGEKTPHLQPLWSQTLLYWKELYRKYRTLN